MKVTTIANWFGSNRTLASTVGVQIGKVAWCGVPFMGGGSELPFIQTRGGVANDLHRHVINLARVIATPILKADLVKRLDAVMYHPDELAGAQARCRDREASNDDLFMTKPKVISADPDVAWAADYAICSWMGRGGQAGTKGEFKQSLSLRWNSGGGASSTRFRSFVESIDPWFEAFKGWEFSTLDGFEFLDNCHDEVDHAIFVDAPWPEDGDGYKHRFDEAKQRRLAGVLSERKNTRIVVRYGDHPLIRALYPADRWNWIRQTSRDQANGDVEEVLIVNGPEYEGNADDNREDGSSTNRSSGKPDRSRRSRRHR